MKHAVSEPQALFLRMLELTSVNDLDGPRIAKDLRAHQEYWRSFVFTRLGVRETEDGRVVIADQDMSLLTLRDLPTGDLHFDSLFLLPQPQQQSALERLAGSWEPEELHWIAIDEAARQLGGRRSVRDFLEDPKRVILRAWWD